MSIKRLVNRLRHRDAAPADPAPAGRADALKVLHAHHAVSGSLNLICTRCQEAWPCSKVQQARRRLPLTAGLADALGRW